MAKSNSLARLEAFSDAVFAIAITLLILEITIPEIDSIHSELDLIKALLRLWPSFFAFLLTFGLILVQWVSHHNAIGSLETTSRHFLYANGFLLLTIVFFPFPAALLASYLDSAFAMPAIVFYCLSVTVNCFAWFMFILAIHKPKLLTGNNPHGIAQLTKLRKSNRIAIWIYAATALLAIWFPYTALIINSALWIVWVSLSLVEKDERKDSAETPMRN
jgi:uncharacterized membrane protein